MKKLLCVVLMLCMLLPMVPVMAANAPAPTPFEDGDVVALFGDSMTQGALYERYLHMYYATHLPDVDFEIVNFGRAGDSTIELLDKLDRDLAYRPDVNKAYVMIGANDVGDEKRPGYKDRLTQIIKKLQAVPTIEEVVLMTVIHYDGSGSRAENSLTVAEQSREVAKELNCAMVDVGKLIYDFDQKLETVKPNTSIFPDDLHPDATGHMLILYAIIEAQGLVPPTGKDLPIITVDAQTNTVTEARNATATAVTGDGTSWSFSYTADKLPFPIMGGYDIADEVWDFSNLIGMHDLLQFNGLVSGSYTLAIDGEEVGTYTATELMRGIDLAAIDGSPIQARTKLVRRKVETFHMKSNSYYVNGHVGEYANLGITKINPTLEEVTAAVEKAVAAGTLGKNIGDTMISNNKNRTSAYAEMQSLYQEVKALAQDRTFAVTLTQKSVTGVAAKSFTDVENHWGKSYILPLAEQGIINGKGEGVFDPDGQITRAEFMTLALKVGNITAAAGETYADVAADAWFSNTVATAKAEGLIPESMVADGNFYPDQNITREEMTAVLTALYESQKPAAKEAEIGHFTDRATFSGWADAPIAKAVALGLVAGNPDGSFNAGGNATRAEAAVMMSRLQKLL